MPVLSAWSASAAASKSGHLDANVVVDCFRLMDLVRRDLMFRRRWRLDFEPGRLTVSGYAQQLDLPGCRVHLSPIQRALVPFFPEAP